MRFTLDGAQLRIKFEHTPPRKGYKRWFHGREVKAFTHCMIEKQVGLVESLATGKPRWGWDLVAFGAAGCSLSDQYVKEIGRRVALTRALAKWPREKRAKVWRAYWQSKRGEGA